MTIMQTYYFEAGREMMGHSREFTTLSEAHAWRDAHFCGDRQTFFESLPDWAVYPNQFRAVEGGSSK